MQNFPFHSKSGLLQTCQGGVRFWLLSERESVPFLSNATFNFAFPGFLMFGLKIKAKENKLFQPWYFGTIIFTPAES